jgi:Mn2+/Fe2+ NRAMP family transporter
VKKLVSKFAFSNATCAATAWQRNIVNAIDGTAGTLFMAVITLWALFGGGLYKLNSLAPYSSKAPGFVQLLSVKLRKTGFQIFFQQIPKLVPLRSGDDIRLIGFYEQHDGAFVVLVYVCLVLFAAELILASVAKKGYLNGFYFWLDAVATMSLLMDIPPFMEAVGLGRVVCSFA